jgi:hypothetical protein
VSLHEDLHITCIPAITRLHGSALCCWQVTPAAGRIAVAAGRRSQLDTATGRNRMGIGFDETSMTGVMRHRIAGDLIMDGDRLPAEPQHRALTAVASPPRRHR